MSVLLNNGIRMNWVDAIPLTEDEQPLLINILSEYK